MKHTAILSKLTTRLLDSFTEACEVHGIRYYGSYQSYEDAKWTLLMRTLDSLIFTTSPEDMYNQSYTKRPDGGCWDILGYQESDVPDIPWVGLHGTLCEHKNKPAVNFNQFKYKRDDICNRTPEHLCHDEALVLKAVAEGKWRDCEAYWLDRLLAYGYIRKTYDGYEPTIIVFDGRSSEEYLACFTDAERETVTQTVEEIRKLLREGMDVSRKVVSDDLPESILACTHLRIFAWEDSVFDRRYLLEQAIKDGWLVYDEHTSPVIGAYLYL